MPIWFKEYTLAEVNAMGKGTMVEHVGIEITEVGNDSLEGTMPVDFRTMQPVGLLHGGANVVLAETLASVAANLTLDSAEFYAVGLEINANHISSCRDGFVTGVAKPIHLGKTTQVWKVRIEQGDRLVCVSRMTAAVLRKTR